MTLLPPPSANSVECKAASHLKSDPGPNQLGIPTSSHKQPLLVFESKMQVRTSRGVITASVLDQAPSDSFLLQCGTTHLYTPWKTGILYQKPE